MSRKLFKINLKPLDWFFFGGEKTFGEGDKSEYFAKSNYLPQQTAILGMLRYQLLKQHNLLATSASKINYSNSVIYELIGSRSFSILGKTNEFGLIKSISPVCISNGDKIYYPSPLNDGYNVGFDKNIKVCANGIDKDAIVSCDDFNPKKYSGMECWKYRDEKLSNDDIFVYKTQIGITKTTGSESDEDAFYKKLSINLKDGYSFSFWVNLENETIQDDIVYIGAERSCFVMTVVPIDIDQNACNYFVNNCPYNSAPDKITLLSNAFVVDKTKFDEVCLFQWSDTTSFRNIETNGNGSLSNGYVKYNRIQMRYNLIKFGSVIYFKPEDRKSVEDLLNVDYMQTIGYNIFK